MKLDLPEHTCFGVGNNAALPEMNLYLSDNGMSSCSGMPWFLYAYGITEQTTLKLITQGCFDALM